MAPRLSIIIPAYNCADYLGQCLDSIADPGGVGPGDDVEVVVVDDGSTDATSRIVRARALADPRIRHLRQDNRGVSAARNDAALDEANVLRFVQTLHKFDMCTCPGATAGAGPRW